MRNGLLVNALRLMDICEEEGTGWDVVIEACEEAHLRSPEVRTDELDGTVVTPFDVDSFGGYDEAAAQGGCLLARMLVLRSARRHEQSVAA